LLTELRYTLGQLHVQVLDLDAETRTKPLCEGQSVDGILDAMLTDEEQYQRRYSDLIGGTAAPAQTESSPLPVSDTDAPPTRETQFEHKRAQTIAILERGGTSWTPELLAIVKEQVQKDRMRTTQIAECRKAFFEADQRPDLNEPITTEPAPHIETS
jgi:hypothetical protein